MGMGITEDGGGWWGGAGLNSYAGLRCSALTHSPQIVPGAFPALQTPTAAFLYETPWGDTEPEAGGGRGGAGPPALSLLMGLQPSSGIPTSLRSYPTPEPPFSPSRALQIPAAGRGTSPIAFCSSQHGAPTQCSPSAAPHLTAAPLPPIACPHPFRLASEVPPSVSQAALRCNPQSLCCGSQQFLHLSPRLEHAEAHTEAHPPLPPPLPVSPFLQQKAEAEQKPPSD